MFSLEEIEPNTFWEPDNCSKEFIFLNAKNLKQLKRRELKFKIDKMNASFCFLLDNRTQIIKIKIVFNEAIDSQHRFLIKFSNYDLELFGWKGFKLQKNQLEYEIGSINYEQLQKIISKRTLKQERTLIQFAVFRLVKHTATDILEDFKNNLFKNFRNT